MPVLNISSYVALVLSITSPQRHSSSLLHLVSHLDLPKPVVNHPHNSNAMKESPMITMFLVPGDFTLSNHTMLVNLMITDSEETY